MKIPAFILLFLLFWANAAFAQTFQPLPGLLEKEVEFEQANECYILFNNPSGDTLQLRWRILELSMPQGWKADLCDYGVCYTGIPPNGTMNAAYDTIQPYLKLIVRPDTIPGSAWLWFRVFEKDNDDNLADVYFSLFTPGTTSVAEPEKTALQVFPNPASTFLFVENKQVKEQTARLLNVGGNTVWEQTLTPLSQTRVDIRTLPAGLYFLQDDKQTQKVVIQK
jgi:hypothetical protein